MKKGLHILIVSHLFPPYYQVGARRPYYMARNLVDLGYTVTVLTALKPDLQLSKWETDLSGIEIIRVPISQLPQEFGWAERIVSRMFWTSKGVPILDKILRTISFFILPIHHDLLFEIHSNERINKILPDLIIASGGPWSIFETAKTLSIRTGAKLYLDYRDAWNPYSDDLSIAVLHDLGSGLLGYFKTRYSKRKEKEIGRYAQGIISVSENTLKNSEISSGITNSCLVTNGFGNEQTEIIKNKSDKMTLTFTGTVNKEQLFEVLMSGIELLAQNHNEVFQDLQINLIGVRSSFPSAIKSLIDLPISSYLNITHYVDINESIRIQQSSDVLISIATRGLVGIPGSKIYEYLKAEKPILLISIADDGQETIVQKTNTGSVCKDATQFCEQVLKYHSEWQSANGINYSPNRKAIQQYSYKTQIKILSEFIDPKRLIHSST